ncbi:MAG: hypothetical protein KDG50_14830 [Chromatiales bacterium]|nr:hypothetical protein [Chromatiales bacterium]
MPRAHGTELPDWLTVHGFFSLTAEVSHGEDLPRPPLDEGEVSLKSSVIGVQAEIELAEDLSLIGQAVSTRREFKDFTPKLEWAYLSHDAGDGLNLRGGLLKIPFFQGAELRYVGLSRPWARPVVPDSGAAGFNDYYGGEFIKKLAWKGFNLEFQGILGIGEHEQDQVVDGHQVGLLSAKIEHNDAWLKAAIFHARYDVDTPTGRRIESDAAAWMFSAEGQYPLAGFTLNAGFSYADIEVNPDDILAYLGVSRRFGRLTPYLLAQYHALDFVVPDLQPPAGGAGGMPPGGGPPAMPPPGAPEVREGLLRTRSLAFGVRYDIGERYALKAEVERVDIHDHSFANRPDRDFETTVFSLLFEGVF